MPTGFLRNSLLSNGVPAREGPRAPYLALRGTAFGGAGGAQLDTEKEEVRGRSGVKSAPSNRATTKTLTIRLAILSA